MNGMKRNTYNSFEELEVRERYKGVVAQTKILRTIENFLFWLIKIFKKGISSKYSKSSEQKSHVSELKMISSIYEVFIRYINKLHPKNQ